MKPCASALPRLPMLEELETRQLLSGTGLITTLALVHPPAALFSGTVVVQGPRTSPGQTSTPANQGPTAPTKPTKVGQPRPKPSPTLAPTPVNQPPFGGLQTLPPGSQGNTNILFGTPITPTNTVPGSPAPSTAASAQAQFLLGNAVSVVGAAGQTAVLAYNLVPPRDQYVVPPDILILGGGGGPTETPGNLRGQAEPLEPETELEEPPEIPPTLPEIPLPRFLPPLVAQGGKADDSPAELTGEPTSKTDRFFASLPQESRDLVSWLDEVALSPVTFNLVLASPLVELARTEITLTAPLRTGIPTGKKHNVRE